MTPDLHSRVVQQCSAVVSLALGYRTVSESVSALALAFFDSVGAYDHQPFSVNGRSKTMKRPRSVALSCRELVARLYLQLDFPIIDISQRYSSRVTKLV
jgi:hypothetical protein